MPSDLPVELSDRPASFVPGFHSMTRDDDVAGNAIKRIIGAFTPEKAPARGKYHAFGKQESERRLETNSVIRAEDLCSPGIRTALKQRVEGLEVGIGWIAVAAGNIGSKPDLGMPQYRGEGVPEIRGRAPGVDRADAERSELIHGFRVVVPTGMLAREASA